MLISPIAAEHARAVAELHVRSLTGLLTDLGPGAAGAYYAGAAKAHSAVGFVCLDEGRLLGFVLGAVHPGRLKKEIATGNPLGVVAGVAIGIVARPPALRSLLRSFRGPEEGHYDAECAELTYLAVAAEGRGGGVGRRLVEAFNVRMHDRGVRFYELSVDDDNRDAIRFYERTGFAHVGSYREFRVVHRRYRFDLESPAHPEP